MKRRADDAARPAAARGGAGDRRAPGSSRLGGARDRSRPRGSTRPTLRQQLDAPVQPRRRADPGTVRRMLFMGALLALMLVILTPTLRSFLQQRTEIAELRQQKTSGQQRVDALRARTEQWKNPAFVKKQAEQRLGFAAPGKQITVYVDDSDATHAVPSDNGVTNVTSLASHPWYGQLWGSIATSPDKK